MFSIPVRTCFKNCCYHFIVVSMEWCIYKVHCIDIAFYLQMKWDGSSEGECMLYMYEVLSPLSLCVKITFAQLLLSRMLMYIYSIGWHGGQVVRRRSRKLKIMGSNPIRASIEKTSISWKFSFIGGLCRKVMLYQYLNTTIILRGSISTIEPLYMFAVLQYSPTCLVRVFTC